MLELLGTIGSNVLSFPGIFGLAAGMTTRRVWIGTLAGALIGIVETIIFTGGSFAKIEAMELIVAIVVGMLAGCIGSLIRIKGSTV